MHSHQGTTSLHKRLLNRRLIRKYGLLQSRFLQYLLIVGSIFIIALFILVIVKGQQSITNCNFFSSGAPAQPALITRANLVDTADVELEKKAPVAWEEELDENAIEEINEIKRDTVATKLIDLEEVEAKPRKSCPNEPHDQHDEEPSFISHEFIPTTGWSDPIKYEWKSNQAYPFKFVESTTRFVNDEEVDVEHHDDDLTNKEDFQRCNSRKPTKLVGNMSLSENFKDDLDMDDIALENMEVQIGGQWEPLPKPSKNSNEDPVLSPACPNVAIIIPYRDRWLNLKILLNALHPFLRKQQIQYQIFVAEQFGENAFNWGMVSNAAFIVAMNLAKFTCVIFHDVDLIPENDYNFYNCVESPRHFSPAIDTFNYELPSEEVVGGVMGLTPEQLLLINGYSNSYGGLEGEDRDLYLRIESLELNITRPLDEIGRYKMLDHASAKRPLNDYACGLLRTAQSRYPRDGISTLQFRLLFLNYEELYTHLLIDVGLPARSSTENS